MIVLGRESLNRYYVTKMNRMIWLPNQIYLKEKERETQKKKKLHHKAQQYRQLSDNKINWQKCDRVPFNFSSANNNTHILNVFLYHKLHWNGTSNIQFISSVYNPIHVIIGVIFVVSHFPCNKICQPNEWSIYVINLKTLFERKTNTDSCVCVCKERARARESEMCSRLNKYKGR